MKKFVIDYMIAGCARSARVKGYAVDTPQADLRVDLNDGKSLAIYVINRAIRLPEIRERLENNTRSRLYTLFVIDGRMMPADQSELEPPPWMAALHSLCNGRVYGYWCDGRSDVKIRPIHMDWKWGKNPRSVAYGPEIDMDKLRGEMTSSASKFLTGSYAIADFGEGTFWKKQEPFGENQYKWSWRQWSYASRPKEEAETEAPGETWDSWEDFERHYGHVGEDTDFWRSSRRQHSTWEANSGSANGKAKDGQQRVRTVIKVNPYSVLGISQTASDAEIKAAYRRKARENHPDMHPTEKDKYTAKMADINAAFEALTKRRTRPDD
ncbi:MAG: J domain-containing protein [bacterium]|nr:J domain-containing protein [bacterium]